MNPALYNGMKLVTFENAHTVAQVLIDNDVVAANALWNELTYQLEQRAKEK